MIPQPEFTALMSAIGLPQAAGQYGRFALYCRALQEWNQKINLTAITDDEGVAVKHFADSLLPLTMAELPQGASLVDVGSGAGFPGLPMALVRPDLRLTFLDSLQKRLTFLEGVTAALGVPAAFVHARAEEAGRDAARRERFDAATARAVANLGVLAEYCLPLVRVGGSSWRSRARLAARSWQPPAAPLPGWAAGWKRCGITRCPAGTPGC